MLLNTLAIKMVLCAHVNHVESYLHCSHVTRIYQEVTWPVMRGAAALSPLFSVYYHPKLGLIKDALFSFTWTC